jgi:N-acetylglucosamine kinase-like BadF-type ATPase
MIFVGVDAGGTHARCAAISSTGAVVGRVGGPGANVHRHGLQGSGRSLVGLVRAALGDTPPGAPVFAAVCAAGLDTKEVEAALADGLRQAAPEIDWSLANDAMGAWKGAFGTGSSGVVAISGTGSVAFARNGAREARAGGWGALLGDEGSGYDIGRRALIAVLREHDHIGPRTSLRGPVLRQLGLTEPQSIIDHMHFHMQPSDVAALAPLVLDHASTGDQEAERIVDAAAAALVEFARAAATAVRGEDDPPTPFALVGGVSEDAWFRARVRLRSTLPALCLSWREAQASPIVGSVRLAMEAAITACPGLIGNIELTPHLTAAIEAAA